MTVIRRTTALLVLLALLGAAKEAPKKAAAKGAKDEKPAESRDVTLTAVGLPVVVGGRLVNYVFVKLKLTAGPHADLAKLKEKEPFFRDALVRAGTATPFVKPGDFTHLDDAAIIAWMMRTAAQSAGPGQIVEVSIAKETPQRTAGFDQPEAQPREAIIP